MMHLSVLIKESQQQILVTFIYAQNYVHERIPLWEEINSIDSSGLPWIVLGDFNVVRHPSEKIGGDLSWTPDMDEFNCCCYTAELEDLNFRGHWFTWSNKCPSKPLSRKLDRVLINNSWTNQFPNVDAEFISPGVSDHSPAIVRMGLPLPRLWKPFKFFNFLTEHADFESAVVRAWDTPFDGSPLYKICSKLKCVKEGLKQLNCKSYSDLNSRVNSARQRLLGI